MDELDAATLAAYRQVLDDAVEAVAEYPSASRMQTARGAVEHIFAAIERREAREWATMQFVRAVAEGWPEDTAPAYVRDIFIAEIKRQARALLKGEA